MWYIINDNYVSIVGYMAYLGDIIMELVDEMSKPKQTMPGSTVRRSITIHLPPVSLNVANPGKSCGLYST